MMIKIKNVEYLDGYKLKILFNNGKIKIVDFENWIKKGGELILPLKNVDYFKKVQMDEFNYTICWPNGADFCPDVLYEMGVDVAGDDKPEKLTQTTRRRKVGEKAEVRYQTASTLSKKRPKKAS